MRRLGRVLGLDDGVGLGEPLLVVAALVAARLLEQRAARDGLVGVEQRLEHLPLDLDQLERGAGLRERLGRDAGDGRALEVRLLVDAPDLAGADDREHAGAAAAASRSIRFTRARACGLRSSAHSSIPGSFTSPV